MAKKRGLAFFKKAVKKTASAAASKNPPFWADVFYAVGPGVASYAVTRLAGRAARTYLSSRFPKARPYLPLAGSAAAAGVLYLAATKVSAMKKYQTAILVGAGVALTQSAILTMAPQLGWLFDVGAPPRALAPVRGPTSLLASDARLDAMEAQQEAIQASTSAQQAVAEAEEVGDLGDAGDLGDVGELGEGWSSPLTAN